LGGATGGAAWTTGAAVAECSLKSDDMVRDSPADIAARYTAQL
jgi:hypothetical protein